VIVGETIVFTEVTKDVYVEVAVATVMDVAAYFVVVQVEAAAAAENKVHLSFCMNEIRGGKPYSGRWRWHCRQGRRQRRGQWRRALCDMERTSVFNVVKHIVGVDSYISEARA
jgi:hypothetical protein